MDTALLLRMSKMLVLEKLRPPNVEIKLVEQNLPDKAIYELPFKVTKENKLRYFQYKVIPETHKG